MRPPGVDVGIVITCAQITVNILPPPRHDAASKLNAEVRQEEVTPG
jgi:hypothetical protein